MKIGIVCPASLPATQFGGKLLELNVCTIEVGQRADILIVKGNPLKDIKVLKNRENIFTFCN